MPEALAILGGRPHLEEVDPTLFTWPVLGPNEENAVLSLMRKPNYFDDTVVEKFERQFKAWVGAGYAVAESSGTHAVLGALFACGVGAGDEVIVPTSTYWASVVQIFSLRAKVVFADIERQTLNIDPESVLEKISPRTKAIVVVHMLGYPVDMERILAIARPRGIKVIEDASHAHGSKYRGKMVGTLADVAAFSLCGKPIAVGEGGMIVTNDKDIYERCVAWGHNFEFNASKVTSPELLRFAGLPLGGVTSRMHNLSAAVGLEQLKSFDVRMREIDRAMNFFWDLLDDVPGLIAHRPARDSGSTMGGWYCPHGIYDEEALHGVSAARFIEAVRAEGFHSWTRQCIREPLHRHPLFSEADVYHEGHPTNSGPEGSFGTPSLPASENAHAFTVPAFKKFDELAIRQYADLFRKVAERVRDLKPGDRGNGSVVLDERGNG